MANVDKIAQPNVTYEFHFNSDGLFRPDETSLRGRLAGFSAFVVSAVYFNTNGLPGNLLAGELIVRGQVRAAGWGMQNIAQTLEGYLDSGLGNFTFTGVVGPGLANEIPAGKPPGPASDLNNWLIGGGVLLALLAGAMIVHDTR